MIPIRDVRLPLVRSAANREPRPPRLSGLFRAIGDLFSGVRVEGSMTKKDKIAFIKSSKRKTHVYNNLERYTDQQLNDVIREIVQGLIRESEIIANAYINGYR